ncbi:MAG: hypothetical protein WDZ28_02840 [Simkaniaceae bacterium]
MISTEQNSILHNNYTLNRSNSTNSTSPPERNYDIIPLEKSSLYYNEVLITNKPFRIPEPTQEVILIGTSPERKIAFGAYLSPITKLTSLHKVMGYLFKKMNGIRLNKMNFYIISSEAEVNGKFNTSRTVLNFLEQRCVKLEQIKYVEAKEDYDMKFYPKTNILKFLPNSSSLTSINNTFFRNIAEKLYMDENIKIDNFFIDHANEIPLNIFTHLSNSNTFANL